MSTECGVVVMKNASVNIDEEALFDWLDSRPERASQIAESIGKSRCYFGSIERTERMPVAVHRLLVQTYGLPDNAFIKHEDEKTY